MRKYTFEMLWISYFWTWTFILGFKKLMWNIHEMSYLILSAMTAWSPWQTLSKRWKGVSPSPPLDLAQGTSLLKSVSFYRRLIWLHSWPNHATKELLKVYIGSKKHQTSQVTPSVSDPNWRSPYNYTLAQIASILSNLCITHTKHTIYVSHTQQVCNWDDQVFTFNHCSVEFL